MPETEPNLNPADHELERALAGLHPAPVAMDLPALAFEAGRRSARMRLNLWRAAAAALAIALSASALVRPEPRVVERYVSVEARQQPPQQPPQQQPQQQPPPVIPQTTTQIAKWPDASDAPSAPAYLVLRRTVLARGIEALPRPVAPAQQPHVVRAADIYTLGDQL